MGWMRSMIEPYAANPRHHRKIYRTKNIPLLGQGGVARSAGVVRNSPNELWMLTTGYKS
jgi:hypothetical protein